MERLWKVLPLVVALAALLVVWLQRSTIQRLEQELGARSAASRARAPGGAAESAELAGRVASLEQTVARVFRMLLATDRERGAGEGKAGGGGGQPSVADLREDVDALLTGEVLGTAQGRKQLHQVVRQVQEEAWEERRQQWQSMRDEMRRARVDALAKETNMSPRQLEQLNELLDAERTQRRALRRGAREGQLPFGQVMEQVRAMRQATDQKVRELLDEKQYGAYEKMREERRGRRGE